MFLQPNLIANRYSQVFAAKRPIYWLSTGHYRNDPNQEIECCMGGGFHVHFPISIHYYWDLYQSDVATETAEIRIPAIQIL